MEEFENNELEGSEETFTRLVKAGKRTYFFDVKQTKQQDFYLTITEKKKSFNKVTGKVEFEKHRIFLYKEDFEKFSIAFNDAVNYIFQNEDEEE